MSLFYLLVLVTLALGAAIGVAVTVYAAAAKKRLDEPRGFEVKLNTGEEPVIEKKEND